MGKLFCSQFFIAVSLACFSLGTQSVQAACTLVDDNGGSGTGTTILNEDIAGYNASPQTCISPIQFDGNITLNANVSPVTAEGTLLFNSNSTTSYTITGSGSTYQALQTTTSGVSLQLGQYLAIENAPITIGPGSLQFNASQNWTGITQINFGNEGFIEFNASGTVASSFVLTGAATIQVNTSDPVTLSGVISSTGSLVVLGPGTLVFSAAETYTGSTSIKTGTLSLVGNGSIASSFSVSVISVLDISNVATSTAIYSLTGPGTINLGSKALTVNQTVSGVFSGVLSGGSGSLTKLGSATLTLSGVNTYTGGTTFSAGFLELGSNSALGTSTLTFNSGTTLVLDNGITIANSITLSGADNVGVVGGAATLSGVISGTGSFVSVGPGDLVLSGNSSNLSGGISIAGGNLFVTNNIGTTASSPGPLTVASLASAASPDLTVSLTVTSSGIIDCSTLNNYGTVTVDGEIVCTDTANVYGAINGSGIIEAASVTVYDNGFVSAGNSPGVLTFIAATDFLPGSTVSVYIDPAQFAELVVIGDLTLGSDVTVEFRPLPGCYANGQRYKFLTVEGGDLAGTFANVDMGTLLLTPSVFYGDGGAVLTVNRTNLTTVATGNNALAVAGALQTKIASDSSPALCSAVGKLILSSQEEISSIFSQMQPSLFKALVIAQENNAVKVRDTLSYRMQVVLDGAHCQTVFAKENPEPKNTCSNDQKPFHAWVDGMGDSLNQRSMYFAGSPQVGYNENMGGIVAGLDYHFAKYLYAGVLGAYTDSTLKWRESQGTGDIQSGYAGLYFSAVSDMFYGNASVIGSWNSFSAHRNINFPLEVVTAKNSHGGDQLLSHIDTGVNLGWNGFTIRPFDSFDYITGTENSYTETGADALDLTVDKSNSIMLRNELGLNFAGCFCMPYGKWMLSPKISWVREVRVKGSEYTAEFEGTDLPFTVEGFFPDRSLVSPGVSLTGAFLKELLTVSLYYNGEFNGNYSDHSYGGQVRFGF